MICIPILNQNAAAQSDNSSISGVVLDTTGSAVLNASITLTSESTKSSRTTRTNESGHYIFNAVPSGLYDIAVEAPGFKRFVKTGNKLDAAIPLSVDARLQIGAMSESVQVSAQATTIQSDTATLGKVVTSNQINNLPLNGRNPIYLALLKAGVSSPGNTISSFNFGTGLGNLNINGGRERDNLLSFDGAVAVRVRANGDSIGAPDLDAVQEVQILTANYPAEYGRSTGGQIRIVTKSGTNQFHGTAYEYIRNSAFDANSWSRNLSPQTNFVAPFRFNQFGYNVNGPLTIPHVLPRNKVFFLFSQEWVRYRQDQTNMQTVPTSDFRAGNFSALLNPNNGFSTSPIYVRDPNTGLPCEQTASGNHAGCFPGNVIPKNRLSPNGVALLNAYPLPTPGFQQGTNNLLQTAGFPQDQRIDTGSVDIIPSDNHYIRFRLMNFGWNDVEPFYGNFNLVPRVFSRPNQTGSLNYVWTISPSMTNEFLFTASHDHYDISVGTDSGLYNRTQYGINYPYLFPGGKELPNKIPTVQIGALNIATLDGGPYPAHAGGEVFNFADNLTKVIGNHTLKAGFAFERSGENDFDQISFSNALPGQTNNQNGRFEFSNTRPGGTGLALADATLGLFSSYAEVGQRSQTPYRGNTYEGFAQDSWRATSKLHLEYGVRYTVIQPFYSLWNNMALFDPAFYNPANAVAVDKATGNPIAGTGDPLNGTVLLGSGWPSSASGHVPIASSGQYNDLFRGLSRGYAQTHYTGFQPRVGIAYSPNQKTVFRAGAGRYLMRQGVSDGVFLGGNPPLQSVASVVNGSVDNPRGAGALGSFPVTTGTIDRNSPYPEAYAWNVSFERDLGFDTVLGVSYVGRRGLHGQLQRNINQPQAGAVQANPDVNVNALRPYLGYGPITAVTQDDNSRYNGLQIDLNHRFSHGLGFGFAYTYAKTSDCGSFQKNVLPNAYDWQSNCGAADFDVRHVAVVNLVYELPFFKGNRSLVGHLLGGWELTQADQFQTGTPFTVATSSDYAGVGPGSGSQIWDMTPGADLDGPHQFASSAMAPQYWFPISNPDGSPIFTPPAAGTFTTQHNRNIGRQPGLQNWNAGLMKNFAIAETQRLTFRFEAFNFINHPNLSAADTNPNSATFGKVTSKNSQRNLQFSLRYSF